MAILTRESINERRNNVKNIDICNVAEALGYTVVQVGNRYCSLEEHDSVRIDVQKNIFFRNSNNAKGDVLEFLIEFGKEHENNRFKSINYCLKWLEKNSHLLGKKDFTHIDNQSQYFDEKDEKFKTEKKNIILPERAENNKRAYAYLTKTRFIHPKIVKMMMDKNMIYQSKEKANCVFVGYDYNGHTPVYCVERGSNSLLKFYHELKGCNYDYGICYIGNKNSKNLFVTESFIDMMSIQSITGITNDNFLSLNGVQKEQALYHYLENHNVSIVVLALDNDQAGVLATEHIMEVMKDKFPNIGIRVARPTHTKDWNEELIYYAMNDEKKTKFMKNDSFYSPTNTNDKRKELPMKKEDIIQLREDAMTKDAIPCHNPSKTIVLDCETTGLDSTVDEMLQLSIIDGDNNVLLNTYLKPYTKTSWEEAEKVNHISYDMVKNAPYFHEIIPQLKGIIENCDKIIGYNTFFDLGFINMNLRDDIQIIDVMEDFAPIYGEWSEHHQNYKWQKLTTCAAYYGFDWNSIKENAHDSLGDCYATLHCYDSICLEKEKELSL